MSIHVILGHTDAELVQAQWSLVDALEQSLGDRWRYADTSRALRQLIRQTRAQAHDPQAWAAAFAEALVDTLTAIQTAADASNAASNDARAVERLSLERDSLRRIVAEYNANPLHTQVATLTQECDRWRDLAAQAERRAQALTTAQQAHLEDIARLQEEIVSLNRIVAQQQEELDALGQ